MLQWWHSLLWGIIATKHLYTLLDDGKDSFVAFSGYNWHSVGTKYQGCGNTMPDLSDLVPFYSGQVENFNLLVLGQVQNLFKVNKISYFIF